MTVAASASELPARRRLTSVAIPAAAIDAAFLVVTVTIGLAGFKTTYSGYTFLVGGLLGLLVGIAIAELSIRLKLPWLVAVAASVIVFFALGRVLPTPTAFGTLASTSIGGWKDLLTLNPPIGDNLAGPLLVIPYLLGMAAGVSGYLLARRTRSSFWPTVPPLVVLAVSILFGAPQPASLLLQGAVFAPTLLAWAAIRSERRRNTIGSGSRRPWRWALGVLMLALGGLAAVVIGPHLPIAHQRVVLRNYVQPPFDAGAYPSPLASFRAFVLPSNLGDKTLMTVSGLAAGDRIRFATMDTYDGLAWGVSDDESGKAGVFQRVGNVVQPDLAGTARPITISIGDYKGVWVPDSGSTKSIEFAGPRASSLTNDYRYNLATGTGVDLSPLQPGDQYTLTASDTWPAGKEPPASASPAPSPPQLGLVPSEVATKAKAWTKGGSTDPYEQLKTVRSHLLHDGAFSNGNTPGVPSLPGHGAKRLQDFLSGPQLVGDDEQYAAMFALLANRLGFPSRVVIGATVGKDGKTVKGSDVHAWVEIDLARYGWVPFFVTPSKPPRKLPPLIENRTNVPNRVPPAAPTSPPVSQSSADTSKASPKHSPGVATQLLLGVLKFLLAVASTAGPPLGVILAIVGVILGAKALRRHRRRTRGTPAQRVSAGWREVVDFAVDLGSNRPGRDTRRRTLTILEMPDLAPLAATADAISFGPDDPNDDAASRYWTEVDELRTRVLRNTSRLSRWIVLLNLASLNGPRLRRRSTRPEPALEAQA